MRSFADDYILRVVPILIYGFRDILTLGHNYFRGHFYQRCTYSMLGYTHLIANILWRCDDHIGA